jgi:hypothetical protein
MGTGPVARVEVGVLPAAGNQGQPDGRRVRQSELEFWVAATEADQRWSRRRREVVGGVGIRKSGPEEPRLGETKRNEILE